MTTASARVRALRAEEVVVAPWATPLALTLLAAVSLYLRSRQLGQGFWIDEGLSVGIAHHHWTQIPHLLRQDGSPPAYYLLLGVWIRLFGDGESATHVLSLVFGVACVPVAYAFGRVVFDRRTGIVCAVLAALNPFLTYYAQESRMYELEAFLSLIVGLAYVQAIVRGRKRWAPLLVVAIALMLYTHNWSLFLCVGLAAATVVFVRERLRLAALVAAGVVLLYLPWLPTLVYQMRHTAAPWATAPSVRDLVLSPDSVLSGEGALTAFALVGGAGLGAIVRRRGGGERTIVLALAFAAALTIVLAWVAAQISPAWTSRYFAVVFGPLLVLAGRGLATAGRLGVAALVAVVFLWAGFTVKNDKENARQIAASIAPSLHTGELVVSTHPEQVAVLRYYLGGGLRFATTMGPVADPQVFDWRGAVGRLRAAQPRATLDALLATVPKGRELLVVTPVFRDYRAWRAKWTRLVWRKARAWSRLLATDPRLELVRRVTTDEIALHRNFFKPLQAFVYRRVR